MKIDARTLAFALGALIALPALADDAVMVAPATVPEPAVIESAKLDPAVIEQGAALEIFGLSSAASTALIFIVIAVVVTVATDDGDPQGVPP